MVETHSTEQHTLTARVDCIVARQHCTAAEVDSLPPSRATLASMVESLATVSAPWRRSHAGSPETRRTFADVMKPLRPPVVAPHNVGASVDFPRCVIRDRAAMYDVAAAKMGPKPCVKSIGSGFRKSPRQVEEPIAA